MQYLRAGTSASWLKKNSIEQEAMQHCDFLRHQERTRDASRILQISLQRHTVLSQEQDF